VSSWFSSLFFSGKVENAASCLGYHAFFIRSNGADNTAGLSGYHAIRNPEERGTGLEQRELNARRGAIDRQDAWFSWLHG